tara:strand:+ start:4559 stop:7018 length:2460 start_codon:yes stop_codon:yes gene_type:complete
MAKVAPKVAKATMYKMISYKGATGVQSKYTPITAAARLPKVENSVNTGLRSLVNGLNALGSTLNTIAANTQANLEGWRDNVRGQIKNANLLQKQEDKTDKKDRKRKLFKDKQTEKRRKFQLRNTKEEKSEKAKEKKKMGFAERGIGAAKKVGGGLFGILGNLFGLLMDAIKFKIFEWIAANPKKVLKLGMVLASIGKFVFNIVGFLGGMSLDGLVSFLENPISLKGFFGIFKFLLGAVPLFAGMVLLKNPKLLLDGAGKVIGGIVGGLKKLFGFQSKDQKFKEFKLKKLGGKKGNFFSSKAGKIATGLGAGFAGFTAAKAGGASNTEAVGAGAGAAGGQALGAKLGEMTGIPGAGAVGGMVGGLAGGKIGQAVGGLIEPIVEPISKFFKMIGDTFGGIVAEIKAPLEEFFKTLGGFLTGILEVVEPHIPLISKIIGIGFKTLFLPLFLGMKALTAVLKLFTGGKDGKKDEKIKPGGGGDDNKDSKKIVTKQEAVVEKGKVTSGNMSKGDVVDHKIAMLEARKHRGMEKWEIESIDNQIKTLKENRETGGYKISDGSEPDPFGFAKGGWIKGPMSGYPVSLDGKSTSFIGHGTEYVGRKSGGRAFVIPFNTPATKKDSALTARRYGEAKRGGYSLPGYARGGAALVKPKKKNKAFGWLKKKFDNLPQVKAAKWLGNKVGTKIEQAHKMLGAKDEEGRPQGIARWLAGAADTATGGVFDFDKRGSMLDGASRLKDNIGQKLEDAKQKSQQQRYEKLKNSLQDSASTIMLDQGEAPMNMPGGDMTTDNPIVIPGDHHHDADKFIYPKYGLIAEFMTDPVEFM